MYANKFGDRSIEKMQLLADEGKYCVLYLFLIQSITPITRTHWQANMPQGSERGSLQCPGVASRGICQFSLGPALKKYVRQIEGVQRRAAHFIENCNAGTRNSYQPLEWVKLDILKVRRTIKNNLAINFIPRSNSRWWRPGFPRLCYEVRRRHLRNSSQKKFIELLPNTETYKNSYSFFL